MHHRIPALLALWLAGLAVGVIETATARPLAIRIATYNIEDLRTQELTGDGSPRARAAAEIIQRIRPNIILINEIAYDEPGSPGVTEDDEPGLNAVRFARLLQTPQAPGLRPLSLATFTAPSNTGRASGFDLDRSGQTVVRIPRQAPPGPDGRPAPQSPADRAYGNDAWGFGAFPGQYGMALLVDDRLTILEGRARTFRLFRWQDMPNNLMPPRPADAPNAARPYSSQNSNASDETPRANGRTQDGQPAHELDARTDVVTAAPPPMWYEGEAAELFRLSSKSHWDIPVSLPNGAIIHLLASHPTPPAFDGPEQRNKRRNHDEIRFWADYIDGAAYIIDDNAISGGMRTGANFVILGDLNADPDEGSALGDPITTHLLSHRRVNGDFVPRGDTPKSAPTSRTNRRLDPDDTADFGLRVDYVLPSKTLEILRGGVWRDPASSGIDPSDHDPVWLDLVVPAP